MKKEEKEEKEEMEEKEEEEEKLLMDRLTHGWADIIGKFAAEILHKGLRRAAGMKYIPIIQYAYSLKIKIIMGLEFILVRFTFYHFLSVQ